jgi:hypothetical protein
MTVNFRRLRIQIKPDLYVKLPSLLEDDTPDYSFSDAATWAALEFERSAVTAAAIATKLGPYKALQEANLELPLLVVTETEAAAQMFAELGGEYPLMVTTEKLAQTGPHMATPEDEWVSGIWAYDGSFDLENPFAFSIEMRARAHYRWDTSGWQTPWEKPVEYRRKPNEDWLRLEP